MIDFFLIVNYYLDVYEIKQVPQWERFSDEPISYEPSEEWVKENQNLFSLFWLSIQRVVFDRYTLIDLEQNIQLNIMNKKFKFNP